MTAPRLKILLIEDNPGDDRLVRELLSEIGHTKFEIESVDRVKKGVALLKEQVFDAVLLDLHLPDSTGIETVDMVTEAAPAVPVVVRTSVDDETTAMEAVKHGAQDYLVKGRIDPELLWRTISYAIERKRTEQALKTEISIRKQAERELRETARENSRLYESERRLRADIQSYASQLSVIHRLGLSLNQETNRDKLLASLLAGAAEITSAGVGVMTLLVDDKPVLVATHYSAWYHQRGKQNTGAQGMHACVQRLIEESKATVIRVADLAASSLQPDLPRSHLALSGLLIGVLRDTRGRMRGYFMLSGKADGADFTAQDEEVVSLLATQASVALTSQESFESEHIVASTLQRAMIPEIPVRDDIDIGIYYRSSSRISHLGGDFYDFVELADGQLAVLIGDVCGKGLEAATSTAMVKYTLRAYLQSDSDPGLCLTILNRAVMNQISMDKFVTIGLGIIDAAGRKLAYAHAGHPAPALVRRERTEFLETEPSVPIGVIDDFRYTLKTVDLSESCSLLMYTDGLIEAKPAGGEPFGQDRLLAALTDGQCPPPQALVDALSRKVNDYSDASIRDDMCMLALQFTH